uniref:Uncharacterized protein n=1 Tax=Anguilla anguilla TaxID=7936 RepID=A0A0E9S9M5_ANGAN
MCIYGVGNAEILFHAGFCENFYLPLRERQREKEGARENEINMQYVIIVIQGSSAHTAVTVCLQTSVKRPHRLGVFHLSLPAGTGKNFPMTYPNISSLIHFYI